MISRSGLWRAYSAFYAVKDGYPWGNTNYGRFRCADFASALQFRPGWEKAVKREVNRCDGLFVDVGANIGFYSVMAAKKGNRVIAFEPNPKAYACLVENIRANDVAEKIAPFNMAVWSKSGKVKMTARRHTDVTQISDGDGDTDAITLDSALMGLTPHLIKIDAEDSEAMVLKGATEILKAKPMIIFEAWTPRKASHTASFLPKEYTVRQIDDVNYLAS